MGQINVVSGYSKRVVEAVASKLDARNRIIKARGKDDEWAVKHEEGILELVKEFLPSGSGFDSGTKIDFDRSKPERLVFTTAFHHMDENGYYSGWTNHEVVVIPSFITGVDIRITGPNRNDIKEYMHEAFDHALTRMTDK